MLWLHIIMDVQYCIVQVEKGNILKKDIVSFNDDKNTPLHIASLYRHLDIIKFLIIKYDLHRENFMTLNNYGSSPYNVATYYVKQWFNNILFLDDMNEIINDMIASF